MNVVNSRCVGTHASIPSSLASAALVLLATAACAGDVDRLATTDLAAARDAAGVARPSAEPVGEFGAPGHAWRLYESKRAPESPDFDTRAAYRQAAARVRAMPLYSSRLGRFVSAPDRNASAPLPADASAAAELGTWEPLGPGNIGGRTRVMVIDPANPGRMYAGGVSGGIWRTRNAGRRWEPVGEDMANIAINSMAMDPNDAATIVVGTGEGYFREVVRGTGLPLRGAGIWRTRDGGDTWEMLASTDNENFHWVNDLLYSPHDSDRMYAATRTGVWRTTDAGGRWRRILNPNVNGGCLDLEIRTDRPGDTLFASCGSFEQATVYRSDNAEAGAAFEGVLSDPGMGRTSIALAPSAQNVIYALSASNLPGPDGNYRQALHAVFSSTSDGDAGTWEARVRNDSPVKLNTVLLHNASGAMAAECFGATSSYTNMGWYTNVLAVDPVNPNRVFAGSVHVFRSDDGGRQWGTVTLRSQTGIHVDHHGLVFHPRYNGAGNKTMYFLNDGGIYRTNNALAATAQFPDMCNQRSSGYRFVELNNNYQATQFYHGVPFPSGRTYIGGTQDNGTIVGSDFGGIDGWFTVFGGDGSYTAVDPINTNVIYLQFQWAQVWKTTDGGRSFSRARTGLDPAITDLLGTNTNYVFITPMFMDPSNRQRLWLGGRRMWRTDDGAGFWSAASRELKGRDKVSAISIAPSDPDRVIAGSDTGRLYRNARATGAGSGTKWPSKRPRKGWVTWVTHDPQDADIVYASYGSFGGKHVYRSRNGGRRWQSIDGKGAGALPDIPVHAVLVDPEDRDRIFLGTDLGVFVTTDGGGSWAAENTGFGNIVTESLAMLEASDGVTYLFAFTHGRGAWRVPLEESRP